MIRLFCVSFALLLLAFTSYAQFFPSPDAQLHYRLIPFNLPTQSNAGKYELLIAKGNYTMVELFKKNITIRKNDTSSRIIVQVPSFGTDYTWQWSYKKNGKTISSPLYHFATLRYPYLDSQGNFSSRMRVTKYTNQYKDAAILVDCTRSLYDLDGSPIWFVPENLCPELTQGTVQDLKVTKDGTFTFIYNAQAYEINYFGDVLTKITSAKVVGVENDVFHHDLTKLDNGNFMVLGNEMFFQKFSGYENKIAMNAQDSSQMYRQIQMGTILEFDSKGNLIWQWKSSDYFKQSDVASRLTDKYNTDIDFHLNAFAFNRQDSTIYIGFRNISRILKLKYPNNKILNNYGYIYSTESDESKGELFCFQHSIVSNSSNEFYVFNNNACSTPPHPELIYFSERNGVNGLLALNEIKRYKFTNNAPIQQSVATIRARSGRKAAGNRGGCFNLLDNKSFFVSLNAPYNELLIINNDGNYIWSSYIESIDTTTQKWSITPTYRSCFISPEILNRKVFIAMPNCNK